MERLNKIIEDIKNRKNELACAKKKPLLLKESCDILDMKGFDKIFREEFSLFNNTELIKTNDWKYYYYTLLYYFYSKDNFYNSPILNNKYNNPSLHKGLFIMGNTGIGKTCLLKTFSHIFYKYCNHNKDYHFKIISSIKLKTEFEGLQNSYQKNDFYNKYSKGFFCIDDVKAEDLANNYGKTNLINELIYLRDENKVKTIISSNLDENYPDSTEMSIQQLKDKYGERACDRILGFSNIIHVNGKSFRR
ncbi:hypothetical protein [Flavobacterium aquatile]|uniref:Uncharacterized protein n=1 Tax=Flavobacterium aquatile LMG 4008 = ATCC 11947 TaxID=1453498 RepID=A0A095V388_9FLAO|nr:hypothetical protein [Flavobacterium aquatile]KGD69320.1 hypothetical protein LG45_00625 [Flavobacterium aquatile LMG 4008 = ATCC 11947]OXA69571.1 hypothetical protein B0A61_00595 [Flavobacterium aquatile LMG 4008 = ATCC 11947]GEC77723.1 hypothetical protein FAQ01_05930 [Flavobacterium aquatile]